MRDAVIVAAVRTPVGNRNGARANAAIRALL
jgi:acetyl-CoA acetyltransferase